MKNTTILIFVLLLHKPLFAQTARIETLSKSKPNQVVKLSPPVKTLPYATIDTGKKTTMIRICAPRRGQLITPPVFVVYWRNKTLLAPDTSATNNAILSHLNPQLIKRINVLKGNDAINKYGNTAKGGAVEVYLKDERKYKAKKQFEQAIAEAEKNLKKI